MDTKKTMLFNCQQKFGVSATNEFVKKCFRLALSCNDFFTDVITGVVDVFYEDDSLLNSVNISDIRKGTYVKV